MAEYVTMWRDCEPTKLHWGVPVVRCRDCKYAQVRHPLNPITGIPAGIEDWRCDYFWNADELPEVEPDGFCAWGERKEVDA
jgi:hypothetical protein